MLDKILGARQTPTDRPAQSWFLPMGSTAGIHMDEETALTYSAVFSAVKVISETVSILPWRVFMERRGDNGRVIREIQPESRLDTILHRRPNPEMTAFQFREFLWSCALLWGNGYAEIERNVTGEVVNLWPIHPKRVEPERVDGALVYRVRSDTGEQTDIPARQMFHLRGPTKDGITGRSMISLARESWGLGIAQEQFASGFFGNGGTPSMVIQQGESAPELGAEGAQNMLESFDRRHKGTKNAGKTAYLERGFEIKTVGVPQKDAQFIEGRKFQTSEVARWFRLPPHKIGDMEAATYSNIEQQAIDFVTDSIQPWIERGEQEANAKLVRQDNTITKMNVNGLLRGDSAARAEYYTKLRDLGVFSINEIRDLEDMNPIDNGDLRLVPLNMVSVDRAEQEGGTAQQSDPPAAIRGVLVDAHERMLAKEQRAAERAHSQGKDMTEWAQEFYSRHAQQMRDALMPGAEALGEVTGAQVARHIDAHIEQRVESAKRDIVNGAFEHWEQQAGTLTDNLIERIVRSES